MRSAPEGRAVGERLAAGGEPAGGQDVHRRRADEAGDEDASRGGRRPRIGVPICSATPRIHHHQPVGERHRLDLVVGDVERGGAEPRAAARLISTRICDAELGVEVRQRLVEQEGRGLAHERAAHGDALALAAGELRAACGRGGRRARACAAASLRPARVDLGLRQAADLQAVGDVVVDAHVRVERVVLEHHGDVALARLEPVDHAPADRDACRR